MLLSWHLVETLSFYSPWPGSYFFFPSQFFLLPFSSFTYYPCFHLFPSSRPPYLGACCLSQSHITFSCVVKIVVVKGTVFSSPLTRNRFMCSYSWSNLECARLFNQWCQWREKITNLPTYNILSLLLIAYSLLTWESYTSTPTMLKESEFL